MVVIFRKVGMANEIYRISCWESSDQGQELTGYETKKIWESNGYSQALVDVTDILRGESQNDEGVEDDETN